jgi:hypothetical protein
VSLQPPVAAVVLGNIAPPQGDIISLSVHLGCTDEVSSFETLLHNWNGKYSPNGTSPLTIGSNGSISVGRGGNCPLLMTCRVENLKYQSTPAENYVSVSGRCWGERLFRRVVTKTYVNTKGEYIIKDLLDYYVGLNHVRNSVELVEDTDTTYTRLEYENTPVFDILRNVADTADDNGVIGYDFRVAPDAKFEFFPRNTKPNSISLAERIEQSEYSLDVHRVRNRAVVYGAADKSTPADKDAWTESLTPTGCSWSATSGVVSLDTTVKAKGSASIKTYAQNLYYASCLFTLNTGNEVDADLYPTLNLWLNREATFNGNTTIILFDADNRSAGHELTIGYDKWFQTQVPIGSANADAWQVDAGFNWAHVKYVRVVSWFDAAGTGSFWVDGLFFGGQRYNAVEEDAGSQSSYGLRELAEVDEELWSDDECASHAKALLANLKQPAEALTLRTTVLDYGTSLILPGDTVHVTLPNENVNGDFRVATAEYNVDARTQTLEISLELGREPPQLADYVFALRSKLDHVSRYKTARRT